MLTIAAWIYGKVVDLRNLFYDRGILDTFDLGALSISIGNITTGGTGKTPLVAYVANILAERGEKVCVLTRGYGRKDPKKRVLVSDGDEILADAFTAGDEPYELAQKLLGKASVIADADRVSAAEWARRKFGVTAFVLDDGFQHRGAKRDLDIVCIDATDPFGGGKMLPAGRLRERAANLSRADVIVITRADLVDDISNLKFEISDLNSCPIFTAKNEISEIVGLEEFHAKSQRTQSPEVEGCGAAGKRAFAFCGIGNPEAFFALLRRNGIDIAATESFRDHQIYEQRDIANIERGAREAGAEILVTTAKDAVKLSHLTFEIPCFVVETKVSINDAAEFAAMF